MMRRILLVVSLATMILAGCDARTSSNQPLPTVVLGSGQSTSPASATQARPVRSSGVTASAEAAPAEQAMVVAGVAGRIVQVSVVEGERVSAGQALLTLDDQAIQAQVAQAQAALDAAQASHDLLAAGPTAQEIRQAQATVYAAQAALAALQVDPRAENVIQAEAALVSAQQALNLLKRGPTALDLRGAQLAIEQAEGARWGAQANRDAICGSRAVSDAQCDSAEAQVLVAETALRQAQLAMEQLKQGARAETIAQAEQAVRIAEAQLALAKKPVTAQDLAAAQAQVEGAQAGLDALQAGARVEQLAGAQAQVAQAQAQLQAAQAQLDTLTMVAPIDGTIIDLMAYVGQWLAPGQTLASLADVSNLVIETTDLSELDVPQVVVGQQVVVQIEALGLDVPGVVTEIAPLADTLGGDVVYQATIQLNEQPEGLRAGMSAEVNF